MADQDFITGPYGSAVPVARPEAPTATAQPAATVVGEERVPFTDVSVAGEPGFAQARARRDARAAQEDSTALEGMGAAIMTWDTTRFVQRLSRPSFADDTPINQFEYREQLAEQFTEEEDEYFTEVAKGEKSAAYAMQTIRDRREALRVSSEHPIAGMATMFLDPMWLAVPPAVRVGKLAPVAGRAVSAAGSAAIAGGVVAAGEGPVSDMELGLGMLLNGAVGAAFYKPGKGMVNADPDFPSTKIDDGISAITAGQTARKMSYREADPDDIMADLDASKRAVYPMSRRTDETTGDEIAPPPDGSVTTQIKLADLPHRGETKFELPGKHTYRTFIQGVADSNDAVLSKAARTLMDQADPAVWDMPVRMSGNARAYVSHQGFAVLRKNSNPFTIVHEAVHVATIRPIQTLLDGNAHMLGAQTRRGVEGLQRQFEKLKADFEASTGLKAGADAPDHVHYAFKDLHEFTAQAISSEKFQKWLADRPGDKAQSAWREFIKHVAEILGIKTTGTKLDEVLDEISTVLTARDTHYRDRSGKVVPFEPEYKVPMPFMHEFSNVFTEEAINNAKRYAGSADSEKGRLVMMDIADFLALAYPRERTYKDLTSGQRAALAEEKRGPIRAAINKGGLDEVPFLTLEGNKVTGHEGRHRADVLREQYFDQIPVVLKGKVPPPGTRLISETGEKTVDLPPAVLRDAQVKPAMVPEELRPDAVNTDNAAVVKAVDSQLTKASEKAGLGRKLQWNMHKTMSGFGAAGKKIADLLYDNNSDLSITSIESIREAALSDLRRVQFKYEDALREAMRAEGVGTLQMLNPMTSRAAHATQARIEKDVQRELFRREQVARHGGTADSADIPPHIKSMADSLDAMHALALKEMKAAGVSGAENILERPGYLNRKWSSQSIDDVIDRFKRTGLDDKAARGKVVELVGNSIRRASDDMDPKLAKQIGAAIVDRALRKGYFEDSAFNAAGEGALAEMRDVLSSSGMAAADVERALKVLAGVKDEAGKVSFTKHRLDLDYDTTVRVGDDVVSITDLIDGRVSTIVDQYNQKVATQVAFARKGMPTRTDVDNLRKELLESTPAHQRREASELFDNTIAHLRGEPAGQALGDNFRLYQTYGRSIALAWSGLWQVTEMATAAAEYGLMKTLKYGMREFPGFKQIMRPDADTATSLNNVLSEHSMNSLRLRPYISRYEDGFEMPTSSALQLSAQKLGQLVPYANAMKFVHHYQAKIVGNLVLDRIQLAAKGNTKAREALQRYGLEAPVMDKLAAEIAAKGLDVDKWDDAVWASARPAFAKMMDAAVLKGRLGDMPAFATFDAVGKFIFSYRTFVLTAHNKVLMGMLEREGAAAVGLVMLYQFPLAMAAVQAQSVVKGEGPMENGDLVARAMGQMGGLGLFSMPIAVASGQSTSFGAPGLIPVDRGVKLFGATTSGDLHGAGSTAFTMLPLVAAVPFLRGIPEQIKE